MWATNCLTESFPIDQKIHWTIRRLDNPYLDLSSPILYCRLLDLAATYIVLIYERKEPNLSTQCSELLAAAVAATATTSTLTAAARGGGRRRLMPLAEKTATAATAAAAAPTAAARTNGRRRATATATETLTPRLSALQLWPEQRILFEIFVAESQIKVETNELKHTNFTRN